VPCLRPCVLVVLMFGTAAAETVSPDGRAIESIVVRGNRKIESDTIKLQMLSKPGKLVEPATLREDVASIWKLHAFSDVAVEAEVTDAGGVVLDVRVTERPTIRKVLIAGNDGLKLDKLNEVLDLERDAIVDFAKVRRKIGRAHV